MWKAYLGFFLLGLAIPIIYFTSKPRHYVIKNEKSTSFKVVEEILKNREEYWIDRYDKTNEEWIFGCLFEIKSFSCYINGLDLTDKELTSAVKEDLEG